MNYKEKYEMALEGIQEILSSGEDSIKMSRLQLRLQGIFPELKESEDKRMVKFIKNQLFNIKKTITENYELDVKLTKAIDWLEKQGEQKSAIWSEEDEINLNYITRVIERLYDKQEKNYLKESLERKINWLRTLKDRIQPQQKQEWSEEDYNEIETIACHLDNTDNEGMAEVLRNIRDKYYIIPQNTWKPSNKQMKALEDVIENNIYHPLLEELLEQLKKLREE